MDLRTVIEGLSGTDASGLRAIFVQAAPWLSGDAALSETTEGQLLVQWRPGPIRIAHLPVLERLEIRGRAFLGEQSNRVVIGGLPSLRLLSATAESIHFEEPLPQVRRASLTCPGVTGLAELGGIEALRLQVWHPGISRLSPRELRVPADLHRIRVADPSALEHLDMEDGALTLEGISRFPNLRRVGLANSTLDDLSPLRELPHLEVVDVRNTSMNLAPLCDLPNLRVVAAAGCPSVPPALVPIVTLAEQPNLAALARVAVAMASIASTWAGVQPLLLSCDVEAIGVACDELGFHPSSEVVDWLLEGVGPWNLYSRHLHADPADRAFHLYALLRLIAQAPKGSRGAAIRDDLSRIEMWFAAGSEAPVDLAVLQGFPKLRTVTLQRVTCIVGVPARLRLERLELGFAPGATIPAGLETLAVEAVIGRSPP